MNPNAIIIKGKSLDALLQRHLEQNGHLHDEYTDENDAQFNQCVLDLRATYCTQETEKLRSKCNMSEEEIHSVKDNIKYMKWKKNYSC